MSEICVGYEIEMRTIKKEFIIISFLNHLMLFSQILFLTIVLYQVISKLEKEI
jgi:hypothetical protein